jgi:hypothetical protein
VVGVDVGVEDVGDSPAAPFGEFKIDLRLDGGIYDEGLIVGPDDVGESPLARAPYLEHFDLRPGTATSTVFQAMLQAFIPPSRESAS